VNRLNPPTILPEYLWAQIKPFQYILPEPSILTYLMVPFSKCILIGGTLLQILNETKQPICRDIPPNTRYNIENNTQEPEFISC
jgi:hypothetical protein